MISISNLQYASLFMKPGWKILYHRLFDLSPQEVDSVVLEPDGFTIWDLCFTQDLLQITNPDKNILLDVGWYPHADPTGMFRLVVLHQNISKKEQNPTYNWKDPFFVLETKSLTDLLVAINDLVNY